MLTDEQKDEIIQKLNERIGHISCPICRNGIFTIIDGVVAPSLQSELGTYSFSGTSLPMICLICSKCGYVSFHAMGTLGLLEKYKSKKE